MAKDNLGHGSEKAYEMPSGKKVPSEHSSESKPKGIRSKEFGYFAPGSSSFFGEKGKLYK